VVCNKKGRKCYVNYGFLNYGYLNYGYLNYGWRYFGNHVPTCLGCEKNDPCPSKDAMVEESARASEDKQQRPPHHQMVFDLEWPWDKVKLPPCSL